GGGFAGAVVAQQGEDGAARHGQVEPVDDPPAAQVLGQTSGLDDRVHYRLVGVLLACSAAALSPGAPPAPGDRPLTPASSSSTSPRISSADRALLRACRSASRMRPRTFCSRSARQTSGAVAVTSMPTPRRGVRTPSFSSSPKARATVLGWTSRRP